MPHPGEAPHPLCNVLISLAPYHTIQASTQVVCTQLPYTKHNLTCYRNNSSLSNLHPTTGSLSHSLFFPTGRPTLRPLPDAPQRVPCRRGECPFPNTSVFGNTQPHTSLQSHLTFTPADCDAFGHGARRPLRLPSSVPVSGRRRRIRVCGQVRMRGDNGGVRGMGGGAGHVQVVSACVPTGCRCRWRTAPAPASAWRWFLAPTSMRSQSFCPTTSCARHAPCR